MYCEKCGAVIEDGTVFCQNCGAPLEAAEHKPARKKRKKTPYWIAALLFFLPEGLLVWQVLWAHAGKDTLLSLPLAFWIVALVATIVCELALLRIIAICREPASDAALV